MVRSTESEAWRAPKKELVRELDIVKVRRQQEKNLCPSRELSIAIDQDTYLPLKQAAQEFFAKLNTHDAPTLLGMRWR